MDRVIDWIKEHPLLSGMLGLLTIVLLFWPRGSSNSSGSGTTGTSDLASAIAASDAANSALQLSADQVRAVGINAAAQTAIAESNNAAAVSIANIQAGTDKAYLDTVLAAQTSTDNSAVAVASNAGLVSLGQTIANLIPTTQKEADSTGKVTDAAGYSLVEMFRNLINFNQGKDAVISQSGVTNVGFTTTSVDASGKVVGVNSVRPETMDYTEAYTISNPNTGKTFGNQIFGAQTAGNTQIAGTTGVN